MKFDHSAHAHLVQSTVKTGRRYYKPPSVIQTRPKRMTSLAWFLMCVLMLLVIGVLW